MRQGANKLKAGQERAVLALLETPTIAAAAKQVGVDESTLRRWRGEPEFGRALEEARREAFGAALLRIQGGIGKAVAALLGILEEEQAKPQERISAARILLDQAHRAEEALDVRQRLAALEAALEARAESLQ